MNNKAEGFTLIELIIVMIIISVLATLISGNFINSLQKGRDARRKNDLVQIQRAAELYYEDFRMYPVAGGIPFGARFCNGACVVGSKVYMMNTPKDPNSSYSYQYIVDSANNYQSYYLLSCIENYQNDRGAGVNSKGFCNIGGDCMSPPQCGSCGNCKFYIGSPNAVPLTPIP